MDSFELMFLTEKRDLRTDFEKLCCLRGSWCFKVFEIKFYSGGTFVFVDG